ncbi:hypothetical protein JCM6882_004283 [Rhodosporidiobolus microsporus]
MVLHSPSKYTVRVLATTCIMSIAAGLFGFDTGTIGSITKMQQFTELFGELSPIMHGVVVAIILVPSAATGALAGNVSDKLSRRRTIALGSAIFALGSAISASSYKLAQLIAGRCIAGAGEGLFLGCLSVYLCEISPSHLRSHMLLIFQVYIAGGVAAGFFVCYGTVNIPNSVGWRFPFILQTVFATALAILAPFMPYSARWLLSKGRRDEAERMLDLLVGPDNVEERRELMSAGSAAPVGASQLQALKDIWAPGVRGRTTIGIIVNMFQQLSGIDFILFYAPLLFEQAGLDPNTSSFIASGVTGLILLAFCILGSTYINKVGRRKIWIIGGAAIAACHFVIGSMYASGANKTSVGKYVVILFNEFFAVTFTAGWCLITALYAAEIQPARTRAASASTGRAFNQIINFAVAVSGPFFLAESSYGPYFTYGAFSALGVAFGFVFMPEVMGKSLESIDEVFENSPVAVNMPSLFRTARLTHVRRRRNSRSQSATLPGETRAEIRAQTQAVELQALPTVGEESVGVQEEGMVRPAAVKVA